MDIPKCPKCGKQMEWSMGYFVCEEGHGGCGWWESDKVSNGADVFDEIKLNNKDNGAPWWCEFRIDTKTNLTHYRLYNKNKDVLNADKT